MIIDRKWHKEQIEKFKAVQGVYALYAKTLHQILQKAAALYAPLAIIQSRPKSLSSFAEKSIRKAYKYEDPTNQITDLCGARIITHTQSQANLICEFIKENFEIDEANSLDVKTRLKVSEFGYLSVHYIVSFPPGKSKILKLPIPKEVIGKKAEIQVRTLLQHTWADISHDRIYKTPINVPRVMVRESARLAALMENADSAFARMAETIDSFTTNYGAFMNQYEMDQEIAILNTILDNEPNAENRPHIALRLARVLKACGRWGEIIEALKQFAEVDIPDSPSVLVELGNAYCEAFVGDPHGEAFSVGQAYLERVARPNHDIDQAEKSMPGISTKLRAVALARLAKSYQEMKGMEKQTRDLFYKAYRLDPKNPYHLASFLEYEISYLRDDRYLALMGPTIHEAIDKCRDHVRVGIELHRAYFTLGRLWLLLGDRYPSLNAYLKGVDICLTQLGTLSGSIFDDEINALYHMKFGGELTQEFDWIRRILFLAKQIQQRDKKSPLAKAATGMETYPNPILIVAGGAAGLEEHHIEYLDDYFMEALRSFNGTVISGGTSSGIPGLVGRITARLRKRGFANYRLLGYIPRLMPENVGKDERSYDDLRTTDGEDFSPLEAIQYWTDLLAVGVNPRDVRLLGINGGQISGFEFRLALALGATVGLLESSGRAASDIVTSEDWSEHTGLLRLPQDMMTIRSFVNPGVSRLNSEQLEQAARQVHKNYLRMKERERVDPSSMPWSKLDRDFKNSNRQQVAYIEEMLRSVGLGIRKARSKKIEIPDIPIRKMRKMAEMEHGRWNVERLKMGWRYGSRRDPANKKTPYLVAWHELPKDVKKNDLEFVAGFPMVLKDAGLEIFELSKEG